MTVTGVDDNIIDGNINSTITIAVIDAISDNDFDDVANQTVTATTTDDDAAGFTITQTGGSTSVAESGTTDTFTIVLNAQPASNVVLTVTSSDTGEATVNSPLTFTSANWNTAQTVTVTGVDDNLVDGNINSTITIAVDDANSDNNFDPVANQTVTATTTDNDVAGFTIAQTVDPQASPKPEPPTPSPSSSTHSQHQTLSSLSPPGDTGEATVTSTLTFTPLN